ncbi:hypothetical protein NEIELOOT_02719 [Neisseria elongata subsp. glycolytica ATCC 29315]|uniref:Uncharacterized protein n=1 Tax=Neisseria elongata subsp. glycolytica ATCC 29315 TaxID=546263 RepID=D4DUF9_NEIEG|nr:hypothetical protein NEIELOOT_02719 [Neisseria elongata subsp. glycolytica ATCC 29315]
MIKIQSNSGASIHACNVRFAQQEMPSTPATGWRFIIFIIKT